MEIQKVKPNDITPRLRVYQRANIPGHVMIHDEEHLFIAPIENISAAGIFVNHLAAFSEGSHVRMVVKSPRLAKPIQAEGMVVRVQRGARKGLAIEFTSITSLNREIIQNYVFETRVENSMEAV